MSSSNYEKNTKEEMHQVNLMLIICSIVILAPNLFWFNQLFESDLSKWFYIIDIAVCALYMYFSRKCIKQVKENETETNLTRGITIVLAVASFLWQAGWAAWVNELVK